MFAQTAPASHRTHYGGNSKCRSTSQDSYIAGRLKMSNESNILEKPRETDALCVGYSSVSSMNKHTPRRLPPSADDSSEKSSQHPQCHSRPCNQTPEKRSKLVEETGGFCSRYFDYPYWSDSQNGCASLGNRRSGLGNISYELSEDLREKEIEFIERCYGGRIRAQRAARTIQKAYREYRLRREYAKIRLECCTNRNRERTCMKNIFPEPSLLSSSSEQSTLRPSESLEDLVIEQAYVDWALKAATEQAACTFPLESENLRPTSSECTSNDSGFTPSSFSEHTFDSSNTSSGSLRSEILSTHPPPCLDQSTMCGIEKGSILDAQNYLLSRSTCDSHTHNEPQKFINVSNELNCIQSQISLAPITCVSRSPVKSFDNFSSPVLLKKASPQTIKLCPSNLVSAGHYVCSDKQTVLIPSAMLDAKHDRAINRDRVSVKRNGFCHCTKLHPSKTLVLAQPTSMSQFYQPKHHCLARNNQTLSERTFTRASSQCCPSNSFNTSHANTKPLYLAIPNNPSQHSNRNFRATIEPLPTRGHFDHRHPDQVSRIPGCVQTVNFPHLTIAQQTKRQLCYLEKKRKRLYRIGLNIFNKCSHKGVEFLIRCNFLDRTPESIAHFLLTRKGLSRVAIGDYLGNLKDELAIATTRQFMRELDFREQEVDVALRALLSCFRTPGESQKIVHLLTEFQAAYIEQNKSRIKAQFRNPDSVMVLAYAIVMLHTDMYSPNIRPRSKMTREEFVRNLRGVDDGEDLDRNLLLSIYTRVQSREMTVLPDHTDQVRKIQAHLTGPNRPINLALPHRRLVCYCRLYEVPDQTKKERPGAHQREVFLFNDLLLLTKAVQKKRRDAAIAYQVRLSINLLELRFATFENQYYPHGLELLVPSLDHQLSESTLTTEPNLRVLVSLNTKTLSDRARFVEDLQECILEVTETDRFRAEEEISKQKIDKSKHYTPTKTGLPVDLCRKHPPGGTSITDQSVPRQTSQSSLHSKRGVHSIPQHGPIDKGINNIGLQTYPEAEKHINSNNPEGGQRSSSDSGFVADLETPPQSSSSCSISSGPSR